MLLMMHKIYINFFRVGNEQAFARRDKIGVKIIQTLFWTKQRLIAKVLHRVEERKERRKRREVYFLLFTFDTEIQK